jgi:hypothetical protein
MRLRWLVGSLLLSVVLAGCIVAPYPVAVGRPHYHRHPHHHGHGYHGYPGYQGYRR